ncbi:MAG: threonine--tRNA ligase [Actinobacteria bacterium]|nr:threonine--tRNA ligase [Actinomycetota bacterium]
MKVILPDGKELELPDGATGLEAARAIGPKLAEQAVLVRTNGSVQDVRLPLEDGQPIQFLTTRDTDDPDALFVLRHSAAHLLAEAVRRLYPGVKVAIGPPIENGFYYDFQFPEPIREDDLGRIEAEVGRLLEEGRSWEREEMTSAVARQRFLEENEPYKVELVETAEGRISLYTQGDFTDLCRGPHLQDSAPIKAVKLTSLAGAYWRGDERNTQLTRIYGTAFYSQVELDAHLERLELAKARDHRKLGRELDLFHLSEESPGSPFWHPKGMVLWNELEDLRRRENRKRGYAEVKTPLIYDNDVWLTSGHWEKFRENMFLVAGEGAEPRAALKPMNCPGHMLLFGSQLRSYRDLPIRYAESSTLHRNELAGALHGLLRVRHVTQDDAHIFCTEEQVEAEIDGCIEFAKELYRIFEVTPHAELSTRPEDRLGTDEEWDRAEGILQAALERHRLEYVIGAGEGTFYGPKIDLHMQDALGRSWQMGTIQADSQMPRRFGLSYMGRDNVEHTPVVIHRALLGSLERFVGILVEHHGGAFPFWLAPVQLRLIPVAETHRETVRELRRRVEAEGFRVDVDEREETLGKRIREAEVEKIPFAVVYGDRESDAALAVRERGGEQTTRSLDELLAGFRAEVATIGT